MHWEGAAVEINTVEWVRIGGREKWRGNSDGDEFGQKEMRSGETVVKKQREGEEGWGEWNKGVREMDRKSVWSSGVHRPPERCTHMLQIVYDIYTVSLCVPVMAGGERRTWRGVKGGLGVIRNKKRGRGRGRWSNGGIAVYPRGTLCDWVRITCGGRVAVKLYGGLKMDN